jgi:hypothetical protein
MMKRDEFGELDAKRFMNPILSKNMILKFPMSAPLKAKSDRQGRLIALSSITTAFDARAAANETSVLAPSWTSRA